LKREYEIVGETLHVELVEYDDPTLYATLAPFKKEPGMSWGNNPGTQWIFGYIRGKAVGVVALSVLPNGTLRFKSDVVLLEYRRMGVYGALCDARLDLAGESGASKASTYAGDKSEPQYTKDGFKVQSRNKGVAYMVKSL